MTVEAGNVRSRDQTALWGLGLGILPKLQNTPTRRDPVTRSYTEVLLRHLSADIVRLSAAADVCRRRHRTRLAEGATGNQVEAYAVGAALADRALRLLAAAGADQDQARAVQLLDALTAAKSHGYLSRWTWPPRRWDAALAHQWVTLLWNQVERDLPPIPVAPASSNPTSNERAKRLRIVPAPASPRRWQAQLDLIHDSGAAYDESDRCWYLTLTEDHGAPGTFDALFRAAADFRTHITTE
ncbi:hypothetical protein Ga0074812_1752 [Parafrankia irregularis]|uniref:Uncharacterized protein n=1 Tax=Parafrankia irregularis TaxID=795642 RepID=A0A0S4R157_9ACTN|nr:MULTISPECIES: hypothetical protein [Parafrankia]MBE3206639.1 hypothetical protein [Parafrankia sp. CH37]CUU61284.1 hypothetical protein Ga0074812_1752 [Parafrankia irregularis]